MITSINYNSHNLAQQEELYTIVRELQQSATAEVDLSRVQPSSYDEAKAAIKKLGIYILNSNILNTKTCNILNLINWHLCPHNFKLSCFSCRLILL